MLQVLLLSIIAKCGVFTHVKELAQSLQRLGLKPVIGFIQNSSTAKIFKLAKPDMEAMKALLHGIDYFIYETDEELLQKISQSDIKLIHAHSPLVLSSAMTVSQRLCIPYVVTLHGIADWNKLYSSALQQAKAVIAIGPEVARSAGPEFQKKIRIIFNGIDTERFKPGISKINKETLRVVWMGRTNGPTANGATFLAKAVRSLRKKGIPIEAKVIGHACGADIGGMEACGWVHDPIEHLQQSHIVFARGRALREAMACGNIGFLIGEGYGGMVKRKWFAQGKKPILSGTLKHGYSRLDAAEIAKDLLFFHRRRDLLETGKGFARSIAVKHFNIKNMVEEICSVYMEALHTK